MTTRLLPLLALPALLAGCTFARTVVNRPDVARLDSSWIAPGRTTRDEIVRRLGPPQAISDRGFGITPDSFRYVSSDTRLVRLEAGYIVTPTFEREQTVFDNDLLVEFDPHGTVTRVSRVTRDGARTDVVQFEETPPGEARQ